MQTHVATMRAEYQELATETRPRQRRRPHGRLVRVWNRTPARLYQQRLNDCPASDPPDPNMDTGGGQDSSGGLPANDTLAGAQRRRQQAARNAAMLRLLAKRLQTVRDKAVARLRHTHEVIATAEELLVLMQQRLQRAVPHLTHRQDHQPPRAEETDCPPPRRRMGGGRRVRAAVPPWGEQPAQEKHHWLRRWIGGVALVVVGVLALWSLYVARQLSARATTHSKAPFANRV